VSDFQDQLQLFEAFQTSSGVEVARLKATIGDQDKENSKLKVELAAALAANKKHSRSPGIALVNSGGSSRRSKSAKSQIDQA